MRYLSEDRGKFYGWKILLPFLSLVILSGCSGSTENNGEPDRTNGIVTDIDYRKCASPCCGGYFIEIEGETERLRFLSPPEGSTVNLNPENLPVKVKVEWTRDTAFEFCNDDLIILQSLKER